MKALVGAMIAAVLAFAIVVGLMLMGRNAGSAGPPEQSSEGGLPPEALAMMVIPPFSLVDQNGAEVTREIFKGRMTLLAFSFTNCPTVCPIMHSHLVRLTHETLKLAPVRIVTISVDPAHDTPEALRAYAERLGVESPKWTMLTGDEAKIREIVTSMRFALQEEPGLPITLKDGSIMSNIVHPTKLVLVGPEATVIGLDSGLDWESAERIALRARDLAVRMDLK